MNSLEKLLSISVREERAKSYFFNWFDLILNASYIGSVFVALS